jgi:hypothetical protein
VRGRDKLIGCTGRWRALGRDGLELQLPFFNLLSAPAERFNFAFICSHEITASSVHLAPSPEAAVDKRMKQAKDPCCATAAVEATSAADWRCLDASSRSAYAHASALAHSRGHVSKELQGPVPGVESVSVSVSDGRRKSRAEGRGFWRR